MTIPLKKGERYGFCPDCIIRTNAKLKNCFMCGGEIVPFDPEIHSRSSLENKDRYT